MRKNNTGHYRLAIRHALTAQGEKLPRRQGLLSKRTAACTQELLVRLNLLGKTRPFCSWHRLKKYDPL